MTSYYSAFLPDITVLIGPGDHRILQPVWNEQLLNYLKMGLQEKSLYKTIPGYWKLLPTLSGKGRNKFP